jgi:ATP-dependent protease ClpP protease subunit
MSPKIKNDDSDDDSDPSMPFDPSFLFNSLMKKDNDIKVDGNKVFFYKGVSRDSVLNLIFVLKQTAKKLKNTSDYIGSSEKPPIYLFINSEGGDYFAGLSAMDHIKNLNYPIYTVIDGMVASAGTFISLAGQKRYMMKSSWVLIHQIKSWFGGMYTYEELRDEMENSTNIMKSLHKMYTENTNIPKKRLDTFFKHDLYISSEEALKLGIIDGIYSDVFDGGNNTGSSINTNTNTNTIPGPNTRTNKKQKIIE